MVSAPAVAKASMKGSAGAIIRCTSSTFLVCGRIAFTTPGPMVMLGTKCPSMTSTCTQSHPAASMARTSSPRRAKSAERIEGAIRMSVLTSLPHTTRPGLAAPGPSFQDVAAVARHLGTARVLHSLDARRRVHLNDHGPAVGAKHVDARHVEAQHFGRALRRLALLLGEIDRLGLAAAVQIGAEFTGAASALHAGDDLAV